MQANRLSLECEEEVSYSQETFFYKNNYHLLIRDSTKHLQIGHMTPDARVLEKKTVTAFCRRYLRTVHLRPDVFLRW